MTTVAAPGRAQALTRVGVLGFGTLAAVALRRAVDPWPGATSVAAAGVFVLVVAGLLVLDAHLAPGTPVTARPTIDAARARSGLRWGLLAAATLSLGPLVEHLRDPGGALPLGRLPVWTTAVVAVAIAQEALLRGRLWDAVAAAVPAGARLRPDLVALVVTTVAFAVIHVPFYGVGVLGVDLAAGLVLGGLRLATGGLLAPITAHVAADLAGWWLQ